MFQTMTRSEDTTWITAQSIISPSTSSYEMHLSELEDNQDVEIKGDRVYHSKLSQDRGYVYTLEDSIIRFQSITYDTLSLSDSLVIKKYKGYYVLSFGEPGAWEAYLAKWVDDQTLELYGIGNFRPHDKPESEGDYDGPIQEFFDIVPFEQIGDDDYLVRPNRKQFMEFIDRGLFRNQGQMHKQKEHPSK